MIFESFDAVFFTAGFFVPGVVWSTVLSMLVPRKPLAKGHLLEFLTLSCINHAFWSWLIFIIFRGGLIQSHPY